MPVRSAVSRLPDEVREQLNRELVTRAFSGYDELATWLDGQGFEISKSALHRHGQAFERRMAALGLATEQAKVIVESLGDDAGAMGEATTALVQQGAYEVLIEMIESKDFGDLDLKDVGNMVSKVNATGIAQKKYAAEVHARAAAAATAFDSVAKAGGLSDEVADAIRAKILGIAS